LDGGSSGSGDGGPSALDAGPAIDAGSCNNQRKTGDVIPQLAISGAAPSGAGGTILEGVYDLTAAQRFVGAGQPGETGRELAISFEIKGTAFHQVVTEEHDDGSATDTRLSATFTTSGSKLTLSITCPSVGEVVRDYTVEPNKLTLIDPGSGDVFIFSKQ
jgi:hypothetical protein